MDQALEQSAHRGGSIEQRLDRTRVHLINQAGPNAGPRATCGERQHLLWPAEDSAFLKNRVFMLGY